MPKRRVGRYSNEFQHHERENKIDARMCMARTKQILTKWIVNISTSPSVTNLNSDTPPKHHRRKNDKKYSCE